MGINQSDRQSYTLFPSLLGNADAKINVYLGNRPNFEFPDPDSRVHSLNTGEIDAIGKACGNGWRKVFNVYAKWLFACPKQIYPYAQQFKCWQDFRDSLLLQKNSSCALVFEPPCFAHDNPQGSGVLHVIMGRTYAKSLNLPSSLNWITPEFAIDTENNLVVCPYFDYRQLSNSKISFLIELISERLTASF